MVTLNDESGQEVVMMDVSDDAGKIGYAVSEKNRVYFSPKLTKAVICMGLIVDVENWVKRILFTAAEAILESAIRGRGKSGCRISFEYEGRPLECVSQGDFLLISLHDEIRPDDVFKIERKLT